MPKKLKNFEFCRSLPQKIQLCQTWKCSNFGAKIQLFETWKDDITYARIPPIFGAKIQIMSKSKVLVCEL